MNIQEARISPFSGPPRLGLSEFGLYLAHFHVGWIKLMRASPAQYVQPNPFTSPVPSAKSHATRRRNRR